MSSSNRAYYISAGLFLLAIIYSDFGRVFIGSIIFTLIVQGAAVYYFTKIKVSPGFDDEDDENSVSLQREQSEETSRMFVKFNNRRKSCIPCLCSTDNFKSLCSGSEIIMNELHANLKDLIVNDKNLAISLGKICDTPLLERLQQKQKNYLIDIYKTLKKISDYCLEDCKELDDSLLVGVKLIEKDIKKRLKDLSEKLKKSGENFYKQIENIRMYSEKVEKNKKNLEIAKSSYEQFSSRAENFETTLKYESKIKIITNKLSKNRHRVEITKDNISKESLIYLEDAKKYYEEIIEINKMKGESHRSYIQCYLTTIQNMWKLSHDDLAKLAEETNPYNDLSSRSIVLEDDTDRQSLKKPTEKYTETKEAFQKLDKFIESYANLESDNMKKFTSIFFNWHVCSSIGLDSAFFDFSHSMDIITENLQEFQKECDFIRSNIQTHIKSMLQYSELTEDARTNLLSNFSDCRRLFLSILLSNYSEKIKMISTASKYFEALDDIKEMLSFNKESQIHNNLCPFYKEENVEHDAQINISETENAQWLNNLLMVYVEEWRNSQKFQEYICKKVAKKLNKDNPKIIGNITVNNFKYDGPPPTVRDFYSKSSKEHDFNYQFWLTINGEVSFVMVMPIELMFFTFTITCIISITDLSGKIRLCYTSYSDDQSWYSFSEMPSLSLSIFPLVSEKYLNINQIPAIKWLIAKALDLKLRNYIYPKKRSVKIPKARAKRFQYP